ncbi:MAG: hypothetical protein V4548_02720 [Bacteroidota bacterium]
MKTTRTYPNIILVLINVIVLLFLTILLFCMFLALLKIKNGGYLIFPLTLNLFILCIFYRQLANHLTYITINNDGIKIYQLLKFKIEILNFKEVSGYSISEVIYGRRLYSSESFIIYTKKRPFEIIKLFNLNFNNALKSLEEFDIVKFKKEPYQTGILSRKYKYE